MRSFRYSANETSLGHIQSVLPSGWEVSGVHRTDRENFNPTRHIVTVSNKSNGHSIEIADNESIPVESSPDVPTTQDTNISLWNPYTHGQVIHSIANFLDGVDSTPRVVTLAPWYRQEHPGMQKSLARGISVPSMGNRVLVRSPHIVVARTLQMLGREIEPQVLQQLGLDRVVSQLGRQGITPEHIASLGPRVLDFADPESVRSLSRASFGDGDVFHGSFNHDASGERPAGSHLIGTSSVLDTIAHELGHTNTYELFNRSLPEPSVQFSRSSQYGIEDLLGAIHRAVQENSRRGLIWRNTARALNLDEQTPGQTQYAEEVAGLDLDSLKKDYENNPTHFWYGDIGSHIHKTGRGTPLEKAILAASNSRIGSKNLSELLATSAESTANTGCPSAKEHDALGHELLQLTGR